MKEREKERKKERKKKKGTLLTVSSTTFYVFVTYPVIMTLYTNVAYHVIITLYTNVTDYFDLYYFNTTCMSVVSAM